eukprot:3402644-Prymnesium_polylepis.3
MPDIMASDSADRVPTVPDSRADRRRQPGLKPRGAQAPRRPTLKNCPKVRVCEGIDRQVSTVNRTYGCTVQRSTELTGTVIRGSINQPAELTTVSPVSGPPGPSPRPSLLPPSPRLAPR